MIHCNSSSYSRQVCLRRFDNNAFVHGALQTQERLLDDIFGFGNPAEHPVRNGKHQGPDAGGIRRGVFDVELIPHTLKTKWLHRL